jgi:hypothetical protein
MRCGSILAKAAVTGGDGFYRRRREGKRTREAELPRVIRVVALPALRSRESQVYMQRYLAHFPSAARAETETCDSHVRCS